MEKQFRKRDAVYACLCSTDTHPTAEWIYDRLRSVSPDISLATVYRNLAKFKGEGRIISVGTVDGKEHFDGNTAPHSHFICKKCGCIRDLPGITPEEALLQTATEATGCRVEECSVTFYGLCENCQ